MFPAAVAGVGFSVDPATGRPGISIEANYGLGESVVSGRSTPDSWFLNEEATQILEKEMAQNQKKSFRYHKEERRG